MNISKKALMSFLMALTSAVSMAQPYYHVMKRDGINQSEEAVYNAKNYKIKVDMVKPAPEGVIPVKIELTDYSCYGLTRSFYFTKFGNLYIDTNDTETVNGKVMGKFKQEEKQYICAQTDTKALEEWNSGHKAHFLWGKSYNKCLRIYENHSLNDGTTTDDESSFWISQKETQKKLKRDLGDQEWAVLSRCEMEYIVNKFGSKAGNYKIYTDNTYSTLVSNNCYMIDMQTTLDERGNPKTHPLLDQIKDYKLSVEEFENLEAQGLVCLPAVGYCSTSLANYYNQGTGAYYWTCTPYPDNENALAMAFIWSSTKYRLQYINRRFGAAVRLVVLAD